VNGSPAKDPEWSGGFGLWVYDFREQPLLTGGNVYFAGAKPYFRECGPVNEQSFDPLVEWRQLKDHFNFSAHFGPSLRQANTRLVTSDVLGQARIPQARYEQPNGDTLVIDRDFFGRRRSKFHPTPGPFENVSPGETSLKLR
jgi:hypothetical protein